MTALRVPAKQVSGVLLLNVFLIRCRFIETLVFLLALARIATQQSLNLVTSSNIDAAGSGFTPNDNNKFQNCGGFNLDISNSGQISTLWTSPTQIGNNDDTTHCYCGNSNDQSNSKQQVFTLKFNSQKHNIKTIITTNNAQHSAGFNMESSLNGLATWSCTNCIPGSNDLISSSSPNGVSMDQLKFTFQAHRDFSLCEILAYSYKNYVPTSTITFYYNTRLLHRDSMKIQGYSAGDISYLSTGKMIGTSKNSNDFGSQPHTCNYIENVNNGGGSNPQDENSYIVIKLPNYLQIKEIYQMGDQKVNFYLGDPFDSEIQQLTADRLNTYINNNKNRQIGTWASVQSVAQPSDVSSLPCSATSCTEWATNTVILSNEQYIKDFFTCGFAIMGELVPCPATKEQCSHAALAAISSQPQDLAVQVGASVSTPSFTFADPLSSQCQSLSSQNGCQDYKTVSLLCYETTSGSTTYATPTFGNLFTQSGISYTLAVSPVSTLDVGQYQCKIQCIMDTQLGVNIQTQTSNSFSISISSICGSCTSASTITLSLGTTSPSLPSFSGFISVGATGASSSFSVFTNSYTTCSNIACGTISYETKCATSSGGTYVNQTDWNANIPTPSSSETTATLTVSSQKPVVHGQTYYCVVIGTHSIKTSATKQTAEFQVKFDICNTPSQSCQYDTSWPTPTSSWVAPSNLIVYTDGSTVSTSFIYTAWQNSYTITCGNRTCGPITYSFLNSPTGTSLTFPNTVTVDTSSQTIGFSVSTTNNAYVGVYTVQIVGTIDNTGIWTGTPVSSTWTSFTVTIVNCGICSAATLSVGASPSQPSFPNLVSIGPTGATSQFSTFTNSYTTCSGKACGQVYYSTQCSTNSVGPFATPTTWQPIITNTNTATATIKVMATTSIVQGNIYYCQIQGTLIEGATTVGTLTTSTFQVQFDVCITPAESCSYDTWPGTTQNFVPPESILVYTDGNAVSNSFIYTTWQDSFSTTCGTQVCGNLTYNFKSYPTGTDLTIPYTVSVDSTAKTVTFSVATTLATYVGVHNIQIFGTVNNTGIWTGTPPNSTWTYFVVTIVNPCSPTPLCLNTKILASTSTQITMNCLVDNVPVNQIFDPFQDYISQMCHTNCVGLSYQLMFANNNTVVPSDLAQIITSVPTSPTITLQTTNFAYSGTNTVYIKASLDLTQYNGVGSTTMNGNSFDLVVNACGSCKQTQLIAYTASSTQPTNYSIGVENTAGFTLFSPFDNIAAFMCGTSTQCGTPTYSLVCVTGCTAGSAPPFTFSITVDASGKMKQSSQTTNASLAGSYTVYIQASLDRSAYGQTIPSVLKTNNFVITIDACNPLPCAYNQINLPITTGVLASVNYLPGTQLVKCDGTLFPSYFSEYTDTVSSRCSGSVYQNLCGAKRYTIELAPSGGTIPITISISYDSANQVWNFSQSSPNTTCLTVVRDYQAQIHASFVTPTTTNSDNKEHTFTISVIYPDPCDPLICTSNQIYVQDSTKGDIYPSDFSIWVNNTIGQTNFSSFRDYKSDNCVGKPGGFLNLTRVTMFTYPVCSWPTYDVFSATDNQPLSSIFGAANVKIVQIGGNMLALQVQTTQTVLDGPHLIYIQGTSGTQTIKTANFTLTVLDPCNPYNCSLTKFYPNPSGTKPQNITVAVGQGYQTSIQAEWLDSVSVKCGPSIYNPLCGLPTFTLTQKDGSPVPFSYQVVAGSLNTKVQVQVTDASLVDTNYTVVLSGYQLDANGTKYALGNSSAFTVSIIASNVTNNYNTSAASKNSPTFQDFPTDYTFHTNETYDTVSDTAIASVQNGTIASLKVSVGPALNFVTYSISGSTVVFKISPSSKVSVGSYPIQVTAIDSNGVSVQKSFTININAPVEIANFTIPTLHQQIIAKKQNFTENATITPDDIPKVNAIIESISNLGVMEIWFSPPIVPVSDISLLTDSEYFMTMEQNSFEPDQTKHFSWKIIQSTPFKLVVQLHFDNPMSVSQGKISDKVRVWMLRSVLMIYDDQGLYKIWSGAPTNPSSQNTQNSTQSTRTLYPSETGQNKKNRKLTSTPIKQIYNDVVQYQFLLGDLPKQLSTVQASLTLENNMKKALLVVQTVFWVPFVIQVALPEAMEKTWLLFGSLQSINLMSQLALQTPLNVKSLAKSIQQTANSQFLDNQNVYTWLRVLGSDTKQQQVTKNTNTAGNSKNIGKTKKMRILQSDSTLSTFQQSPFFGLGSSDKVLEAGAQFAIAIFLLTMLGLLIWFLQITLLPFLPQKIHPGFHKLKDRIFWSLPLRVLSQQYFQVTLAVMINLKFQSVTNFQEQKTNLGLSIALLIFYSLMYPVWMIVFLRKNKLMVSDSVFNRKWNGLYLNVDLRKFLALFLLAGVLIRRFLFAFTAVGIDWNIIQLTMIIYTQQFMTQFVLYVWPMESRLGNQILVFNEVMISMLCIILYLFTDYVPSPEIRYEVAGWCFCYIVYLIIAVTMIVWLHDVFQIVQWQLRVLKFYYELAKRKSTVKSHNKKVDVLGHHNTEEKNQNFKKKLKSAVKDALESIESQGSLEVESNNLSRIERERQRNFQKTVATRKQEFEEQMMEMKLKNQDVSENVLVQKVLNATQNEQSVQQQVIYPKMKTNKKFDHIFGGLIPTNQPQSQDNVLKKVQEHSDWPIDPTHAKVVEAKRENWSWDHDIASDVSLWNALPADYSLGKSIELSVDNLNNESEYKLAHLGKLPTQNEIGRKQKKENLWISNEMQEEEKHSDGAAEAERLNQADLVFKVAAKKRKPIVARQSQQDEDDFFGLF